MTPRPDYDVLIAGGGPVGGALAAALRDRGLRIAVLDRRAPDAPSGDFRPLALSHGSRLILERLGVWDALGAVTPITRIHVSQRAGFGRVLLDAGAMEQPALGYVLDYTRFATTVAGALQGGWCDALVPAALRAVATESGAARVELDADGAHKQCTTRLVVIADGGTQPGAEEMRTTDYHQAAVTARVECTEKHNGVAYERFTPEGPLALLPAGERLALVWTLGPERARELCAAPEAGFLAALQRAFGERLGRFRSVEKRAFFPLALKVARDPGAPRVVRIGNAAQTLHPVAGQGLNLGLRDAWELAQELERCATEDIGSAAFVRRYAARRRLDRAGGIGFTHGLVHLFSRDFAPLNFARGAGLAVLAAVPPARDFLARRMTFGSRG